MKSALTAGWWGGQLRPIQSLVSLTDPCLTQEPSGLLECL
jgi:hypothetical protein